MDAVTYPHEVVKKELGEHWVAARYDVGEAKPVATLFGVSAIPVAVAVTSDGKVLGEILGFVEPEHFERELKALRTKR